VYSAFYKLANPSGLITSYINDILRSTVPKLNLDSVFECKDDIALAVKKELSATMSSYGFNIINALVTDISPNAVVKQKMNEINAEVRVRQAASEKGEAEKIMVVKAAEAQSESAYLAGVGIARQRKAIIEGLQDSLVTFSGKMPDVSAKDVLQLMLMTQYMDTLRDIGNNGNSNTLFVHHSPSAVSDITAQIRDALVHSAPPRQDMERVRSNQIVPLNGQEPR
jgi:regulator of protease activity HflC (stomatin/prohibitin superfamily)